LFSPYVCLEVDLDDSGPKEEFHGALEVQNLPEKKGLARVPT
jgi:hypothetical protein